jgi:hypothetical protein
MSLGEPSSHLPELKPTFAPGALKRLGRPSSFKPEFCKLVVSFCSQGYSLSGFAGHILVSRQTIDTWMHEHPLFFEACSRARVAAALWWEQRAIAVAAKGTTGGSQAQMIMFGLKNLAADDWRDRIEHTGADGGPINLEALLLRAEEKRDPKVIEHEPATQQAELTATMRDAQTPTIDPQDIVSESAESLPEQHGKR